MLHGWINFITNANIILIVRNYIKYICISNYFSKIHHGETYLFHRRMARRPMYNTLLAQPSESATPHYLRKAAAHTHYRTTRDISTFPRLQDYPWTILSDATGPPRLRSGWLPRSKVGWRLQIRCHSGGATGTSRRGWQLSRDLDLCPDPTLRLEPRDESSVNLGIQWILPHHLRHVA
jgi:hypothetical protein